MSDVFSPKMIRIAAERLAGRIVRTPLLDSPMLDTLAGCRLFVKAETLQRTGAFKYRGALNKLLTLSSEVRARGIVAFSSGNHGHAIAAAAAQAQCPATIVLPSDAPAIKVDNCRWWGAEIVFYDPAMEDREAVGRKVAEPRGMTVVPPFDDHEIIAGQGTAGLEIAEDLSARGIKPDVLLSPCSGGGLAAGTVAAIKDAFPDADCYFVEPAGLEKMAPSVATGRPHTRPPMTTSILDGITGPIAGTRTTAILRCAGASGLSIDENDALSAMQALHRHLKLVSEPAGAAAVAAVISRKANFNGKNVVALCSGGNVDPQIYARALVFAAPEPLCGSI